MRHECQQCAPSSLDELSLSANNGEAKLREVGTDVGLIERKQCSYNVVPNEISNGKMDASELFAQAPPGSAPSGRGSWDRRNLGKRMFKFAQGAKAIGINSLVVRVDCLVVAKPTELANVANPLLPVPLNFAMSASVAKEVDNFLGFEVASTIMLPRGKGSRILGTRYSNKAQGAVTDKVADRLIAFG